MNARHFKHFEIQQLLGRGGMGEVYLAHDATLERYVALKFLPRELLRDPSAQGRLLDEARSVSRVSHPNIAMIHSIEEDGGIYALCMEYVDGLTLKQVIGRTRLNLKRITRIATDITAGMQAAHEQGVIHRDLKPANVMISRRDEVKIMDFGLALRPERVVNTLGPNTYGTVQYMSPEQARGETLTAASDIFSFGSTLYEAICGVPPFDGENDLAILQAIIHNEPRALRDQRRDVPPALEQLVRGCLAKDPAARWGSMHAITEELRYLGPSVGTGPSDLISELSSGLRDPGDRGHHQPDNAGAVGRRKDSGNRRPLSAIPIGNEIDLGLDLPEGVYVHHVHDSDKPASQPLTRGIDPVVSRPSRPPVPKEEELSDGRTGQLFVQTTGEQWREIADRDGHDDQLRRRQRAAVAEKVRQHANDSRAIAPLREAQSHGSAHARPLFLGIEEDRGTRDVMRPLRLGKQSAWNILVPVILAVVVTLVAGYALLRQAGWAPTPAPPENVTEETPVDAAKATPTPPVVPQRATITAPMTLPPELLRRPQPSGGATDWHVVGEEASEPR